MRIPVRALKYCTLALGVAALAGAALLLAPGRGSAHEGGYLDFTGPGSGYLEVPDNAALNPASAITVEAWIYLNSYEGWGTDPNYNMDPQCPMLVGKNYEQAYALALGCGGNVADSFLNGIDYSAETTTIPLQIWTHVAMTYNGATRRVFVNGVDAFAADDLEGPITVTADPLRIGDDVRWDLSPNGRIDDVRIWNIARTQAEIQAGMNGVAATTPGLVADWTFDNGSLTDAASGLTGALHGDVHLAGDNPTQTATPTPSPSPSPTATTASSPTPTPSPTLSPTPIESATPAPTYFNGSPSPGDFNCDGRITAGDGSSLLATLAGVIPRIGILVPFCNDGNAMIDGRPARDDANCDRAVNVLDVLAIFKQAASIAQLPPSCPAG